MKKLFGHPDFAPVLASDTLLATSTSVKVPVAHTVSDSWVAPRDTQILGVSVSTTGVLAGGEINFAVTYDGAVAATGELLSGARAEAVFVPFDRQNAVVASSGALIEVCYTVVTDLGSAQTLRMSVPVEYIGRQ